MPASPGEKIHARKKNPSGSGTI